MSYRALIFDDQKMIRQLLWTLFDDRGYEVFTFPDPALCPLSEENHCPCPEGQACSDVILSDLEMPHMDGLEFVEKQIQKGCRCKNIALMSGAFTDEHFARAKQLGITIFKKPFQIADINRWLDRIEEHLQPGRKLADWFLGKIRMERD